MLQHPTKSTASASVPRAFGMRDTDVATLLLQEGQLFLLLSPAGLRDGIALRISAVLYIRRCIRKERHRSAGGYIFDGSVVFLQAAATNEFVITQSSLCTFEMGYEYFHRN